MESMAEILQLVFIILFFLLALWLYIWAIVNIHKRKFRTYSEKGLWLSIVIISPVFGATIYLFIKRRTEKRFHGLLR